MINILEKKDCCGCTACASVCSHKAITMIPDKLGFLYPHVDIEKCTNCGLCERVCAFNENYDKSYNLIIPEAIGARHKNISEVNTSRSGAAFIAFSDYILEKGGIVYGAGYNKDFVVIHKRAQTKEERNEFKGSKYVQSNLNNIFLQVKQDLISGKKVLFSGTPCQTAGLNSFISSRLRSNLILVDIVCHGVPSPSIWKDYLKFIQNKYNQKVSFVNFRDKSESGWDSHKETFILENGNKISPKYNPYTELFNQKISFRPSCGNCYYCNTTRPSDITIADFWGWEKICPEFNKDNKGISLILINSTLGKELFSICKENLIFFNVNLKDCLQPNLIRPTKLNNRSNVFENDFSKYGFEYILKKYTRVGIKHRLNSYYNKIFKKISLWKSVKKS